MGRPLASRLLWVGPALSAMLWAGGAEAAPTLLKTLAPEDGCRGFGGVVALDSDLALILSGDDTNGIARLVNVFERNHGGTDNWGLVSQLADPALGNSGWGWALAASGDVVAVGDPYFYDVNNNTGMGGRAYVLDRIGTGWSTVANLDVHDICNVWDSSELGRSIGLSGDTLMVGAVGSCTASPGTEVLWRSAVLFYERDASGPNVWGRTGTFPSTDIELGGSVAIDGDLAISSAHSSQPLQALPMFVRSGGTWSRVDASLGGEADCSGGADCSSAYGVAISGTTVAVAVGGAVLLYEWSQGSLVHLATVPLSDGTDSCFYAPRLSGDRLAVGIRDGCAGQQGGGEIRLYGRDEGGQDNWGEFGRLSNPDPEGQGTFGSPLSFSGARLLAGSSRGAAPGTAYIFGEPGGSAGGAGSSPGSAGYDDTFGPPDEGGCACRTTPSSRNPGWALAGVVGLVLVAARRRR